MWYWNSTNFKLATCITFLIRFFLVDQWMYTVTLIKRRKNKNQTNKKTTKKQINKQNLNKWNNKSSPFKTPKQYNCTISTEMKSHNDT